MYKTVLPMKLLHRLRFLAQDVGDLRMARFHAGTIAGHRHWVPNQVFQQREVLFFERKDLEPSTTLPLVDIQNFRSEYVNFTAAQQTRAAVLLGTSCNQSSKNLSKIC